jgi:hypothetical protein
MIGRHFAKMLRVAIVAAAMVGPAAALARPGDRWDNRRDDRNDRPWSPRAPPHRTSVPEFDPAAAGAVAAVLAGGGLLLARRRRGQ